MYTNDWGLWWLAQPGVRSTHLISLPHFKLLAEVCCIFDITSSKHLNRNPGLLDSTDRASRAQWKVLSWRGEFPFLRIQLYWDVTSFSLFLMGFLKVFVHLMLLGKTWEDVKPVVEQWAGIPIMIPQDPSFSVLRNFHIFSVFGCFLGDLECFCSLGAGNCREIGNPAVSS